MISESFWNYCRDEVNDCANEIDDNYQIINNNKTKTTKFFEYKAKIIGNTLSKLLFH